MVNVWLRMVNSWNNYLNCLVVTGTMEWIMTFHALGMSSSQLTNSYVVVWNMNFMTFHIVGMSSSFRGVGIPPTS